MKIFLGVRIHDFRARWAKFDVSTEGMLCREFQMAEIEHFCRDDTTEHPKFREIAKVVLRWLPKENQTGVLVFEVEFPVVQKDRQFTSLSVFGTMHDE